MFYVASKMMLTNFKKDDINYKLSPRFKDTVLSE